MKTFIRAVEYWVPDATGASLTFGGIIAFVSSAQQIFVDEFHAGERFTLLFAACAFSMGCASFLNSRLVERLGTRLISQTAVMVLIALSLLHLLVIGVGVDNDYGHPAPDLLAALAAAGMRTWRTDTSGDVVVV